MADGIPVLIAEGGDSTSSTSLVLTLTAAAPAGSQINVAVALLEAGTAHTVTDTAGNTYVPDATLAAHATANLELILFRASDALALAISDTITISWTTAVTNKGATAFATTGMATSTPLTGTPSVAEGSGDQPSSGTTTTTDANATLIGFVCILDLAALTEDANFTGIDDTGGDFGRRIVTAYRKVTATETMDYSPTFASPPVGAWTAAIAAYKAAASAAAVGHGLTDSVLLNRRRLVA